MTDGYGVVAKHLPDGDHNQDREQDAHAGRVCGEHEMLGKVAAVARANDAGEYRQ
jgi:hypothetical protein